MGPRFLVSAKTGDKAQWARVVSDYTAERSDELTLTKGVLVKIVMKDNDNWWLGQISDSVQGYVPAKCLEVVSESDAQAMSLLDEESSRVNVGSVSTISDQRPTLKSRQSTVSAEMHEDETGSDDKNSHEQPTEKEAVTSKGRRRTGKSKVSQRKAAASDEGQGDAMAMAMEQTGKNKINTEDSVQEIEENTEVLL